MLIGKFQQNIVKSKNQEPFYSAGLPEEPRLDHIVVGEHADEPPLSHLSPDDLVQGLQQPLHSRSCTLHLNKGQK